MRTIALLLGSVFLLVGCGDSVDGAAGSAGTAGAGGSGGGVFTATLGHTFDVIPIDVGEELGFRPSLCQKWTLNNDEPLYVSKVRQTNNGAWHHSNWFFVPEAVFGEDGTFECRSREFGEVAAAALGGVFFAQSTQTFEEIQAFPQGSVLVVPPRSAIVGDVHLVNVSAAPIDSAMRMEIETVAEEDVETQLYPISFSNDSLEIPAQSEARYAMTCDLGKAFSEFNNPIDDFNIYYVLAHYHQWGNYFKLSFMDDNGGEQTIFEFNNRFGEPIGSTIDPPINSNGMGLMRMECGYMNDTERVLEYGFAGFEMCVMLAYTDAPAKVGMRTSIAMPMGQTEDGIFLNEGGCEAGIALEVAQ